MDINHKIPCPNCGGKANRRYFVSNETFYNRCQGDRIIQTECPECDYLLVMCSLNGSVVEACSSSTSAKTRHLTKSEEAPSFHGGVPLTSSAKTSSRVFPLLKPLPA